MKKLTIVTPTYNRAATLPKVYESLKKQTCNDFLWLIIDDGSQDNTQELLKNFQEENVIEINYKYKDNGGKASALNYALSIIETDYCCCLDSDDFFEKDAVEKAINLLDAEIDNERCCGIVALRNRIDGQVLANKELPKDNLYISIGDIYYTFNIKKTELICFYKSKIAKKYRFPEFDGEKFVSPTWFQLVISENYVFKTSKDKFCYCEYLSDGLTRNKNKVILNNPKGYTEVKKEHLKQSRKLKHIIKNAIMYDCGCIIGKEKHWLKKSPKKIISIVCIPAAYIIYFKRFGKK